MIACKHCKGKGAYIVQETYGDGDTALMAYECNYCHGTGGEQDSIDDQPFDLGDDNDDDD